MLIFEVRDLVVTAYSKKTQNEVIGVLGERNVSKELAKNRKYLEVIHKNSCKYGEDSKKNTVMDTFDEIMENEDWNLF